MNLKKLFLMLTFFVLMGTTAFAQLDTVYVDATQGNNLNNGQYPTLVSPLVGPVATIAQALTLLDTDGVIMIAAATAGTMDYGSPTITGKGSVTLKAYVPAHSPSFHVVSFNTLTINEASKTIQILTDGTAYFETVGNLVLTAGKLDINTAADLQIASGSTLSIANGAASLVDQAPQKGNNLNITYNGAANMTAGPETGYASLGTGALTFANTGGKVIFNANVAAALVTVTGAGDAAINGNLTMGFGNIVANAGGDLVITGNVNFGVTLQGDADAEIGTISHTGSGVVSVSGTTTWTADTDAVGGALSPLPIVFTAAGNDAALTLGALVFVADGGQTSDFTATITNAAGAGNGDLTIGSITAAVYGDDDRTFTISLNNNSTGTLTTGGGAIKGTVTNTAASPSKLVFSGAATVTGAVTNTSTGEIEINADATFNGGLTLSAAGDLDVNADLVIDGVVTDNAVGTDIDIAAGKIIKLSSTTNRTHVIANSTITGTGTLVLEKSGTKTFGNITGVNVSVLTGSGAVTAAAVTLSGKLQAAATTTITGASSITTIELSAGTFTFGSGGGAIALTVDDFTQTGGTFAIESSGGRTLDVNKSFTRTGGTFQVPDADLTVAFTGTSNQSFTPGTTMQVGKLNFDNPTKTITMAQSVSVVNSVTITTYTIVSMGQNNITLTGNNATFYNNGTYTATGGGGLMITGASTSTPTGGVGDANYINLRGTSPYGNLIISTSDGTDVFVDVETVTFNGQITLNNGGLTLNNANADAGPNVILSGDAVKIIVNLAGTNTNIGVLNASVFNSTSNLYDLQYNGTLAGVITSGSEFVSGSVRDLNVNITNILANTFDIPAGSVIEGDLTVGASAILGIGGGSLEVEADGAVVSILGTIEDELIVSGANATVTGSTASAAEASVNDLTLESTTKAVVSLLKEINGDVETGTDAIVDFSVVKAADSPIEGQLILGGDAFNALSDIEVQGGVALNAGVLALGANDVELTTGGAYVSVDGASVTSTGGKVIVSFAMNGTFDGVAIPYLTVNDVIFTLTDDLTVEDMLSIEGDDGAIAGGQDVNILSGFYSEADQLVNATTITGNLTFKGTTVTLANDLVVSALTVDSDTSSVATIVSSDETSDDPTKRTITVTGDFTQTLGNVDQGLHDIVVNGTYNRTLGSITQTTGALVFDVNAAAVTVDPGEGWSIKNLTIDNVDATPGVVKTINEEDFTVTGTLKLVDGVFDTKNAGELHLADGATISIDRTNATLNDVPTFDGLVNVTYTNTASASTAKELPTSTSVLKNLTVNGAEAVLAAAVTVNNAIYLTAGNLDNSAKQVTLVDGGTIVRAAGTFEEAPAATNYTLSYTADLTEADEFIDGEVAKVIVAKNKTWTLGESKTIGDLDLSAAGATAAVGAYTLTVEGNLNMAAGNITVTAGSGALVLGGTTQQTFTVPSAGYTLAAPLTLNNEAGFVLSGGNLIMSDGVAGTSNDIIFVNGVLTTGDNAVVIDHSVAGMGFDHTGVADTNASHINGNVKVALAAGDGASGTNGRYEFPVGSTTKYRPYAITFDSNNPVINPTSVVVKHVDTDPEGTKGLPIKVSDALTIGNYPDYYWLVKTTPSSFSSQQVFDVEVTGTNIGIPYTSDQDLRILKRQDGSSTSNGWSIEGGTSALYSNYQVVNTLEDTSATVRTAANVGGLTVTGVRFTIGVPTRAPIFTAPTVLADSVDEGVTKTIQVTADPQDVGETITYSLVGAPAWAAINPTSGLLTLTPGFDAGSATAYEIVVRASDGGSTTDLTLSIVVVDANRAPSFTATGASVPTTPQTVKYGTALVLTYVAVDADATTPTYSYTVVPTPAGTAAIAAGVLTFTPAFADAGKEFTFSVAAVDASTFGDTVDTKVNVTYAYNRGDVNKSGTITAADAAPILEAVVGLITLTDEQKYYADVNGDDVVGAIDAAWILYAALHNGTFPTAKSIAASGNVEFGGFTSENGVYSLPISLSKTSGVLSVYTEINLGSNVEFKSVTSRLPEGWIVSSNFENGVLKVAMAGTEALNAGSYAVVNLTLTNKEAVATVEGSAKLNDETSSTLVAKVREIPAEFALSQNYPNPFNPTTSIKYQLANNANVKLIVYNMLGQVVKTLVNQEQEAGYYTIRWNGTNDFGGKVSSGIYIYRIIAGDFISTVKMNLLK